MSNQKFFSEKNILLAMYILMGAVFFIPFVSYSGLYFPFIVARNVYFRVLVELMAVGYVWLVLQNKKYLPSKQLALKCLAVFVAVMAVSSLINGNLALSFWSGFERMDGLVGLCHLAAFFVMAFGILRERRQWENLLQVSFFVSLAIAFIGLGQMLKINILLESSGGERISATLGNPTYLAAYLLIHVFIGLYFLVRRGLEDVKLQRHGWIILDLGLIVASLVFTRIGDQKSVLQLVFSDVRLFGPFVVLQALALSSFFSRHVAPYRRLIQQIYYGGACVLFLAVLSQTQTRGALVGLALAGIVLAILLFIRRQTPRRYKLGAVIGLIIVSVGIWQVWTRRTEDWVHSSPFLSRVASISWQDATTQTRLATWQASWQGFKDKPILGWGAENFYQVFDRYFPTVIYKENDSVVWFDKPHNLLIQYAIEGGILGLGAYLVFIIVVTLGLLRNKKEFAAAAIFGALTIAYIGQNLFVFDSINSSVIMFFVFAFMVFLSSDRQAGLETSPGVPVLGSVGARQAAMTGAVIAVLGAMLFINYIPATTNAKFLAHYLEAESANSEGALAESHLKNMIETAKSSPYLGRLELMSATLDRYKAYAMQNAAPEYLLAGYIDRGGVMLETETKKYPAGARPIIQLMDYYLNTAKYNADYLDRVIALREQAVEYAPNRAHIYLLAGNAQMLKKQYAEGIAEFERAKQLAPNVLDPNLSLFGAYLANGQREQAMALLDTILKIDGNSEFIYLKTASFLASTKNYGDAETVLKQGIERHPASSNLYAALADVLASQGKNDEAKAAVAQAVANDASFAEEAAEFIKEVDAGTRLKVK